MIDPVEQWKFIPAFGDRYEVSDYGRVRGYYWPNGQTRQAVPRLLSPRTRPKRGYQDVLLVARKKRAVRLVHRLVLEAFVGPCPTAHEAAHGDGDPRNNRLTNLRWATHRDNVLDTRRHGTWPAGEKNGRHKLTTEDVRFIRAQRPYYGLLSDLGRQFGVRHFIIGRIRRGVLWAHI